MRYSVIFYCYKCVQFFICKLDLSNCFSFRRQHGRVVSASDLQCCGPGFVESCSGLRPLTGFVLGCYEFKYSAMPINCLLAVSCQLGFLVL